jgi:peptidoglycan/xylan/chitin deacetylase (PgdA/CDA1 family)
MRIERHPAFVEQLRAPRFELAVHGLHHFAPGHRPPEEFGRLGAFRARRRLKRALQLFGRAGLTVERGFAPPAWTLPPTLQRALVAEGYEWVSSARDLQTPIAAGARTAGSGLQGVDLIGPQRISGGRLVHVPVNIQAPLDEARAAAIVDARGLVSIKAHAVVQAFDYVSPDGLDQAHVERLDEFLTSLEDRYGARLWWASLGDVARRV